MTPAPETVEVVAVNPRDRHVELLAMVRAKCRCATMIGACGNCLAEAAIWLRFEQRNWKSPMLVHGDE